MNGTGGSAGQTPDASAGGAGTANGGASNGGSGLGGAGGALTDGGGGQGSDAGDGSAIGELGAPCDKNGALACGGHWQKLQLLCSGGVWTSMGVCANDLICDTTPGTNAGSCQKPAAECAGKVPGAAFCQGYDRKVCGPDLITVLSDPCPGQTVCKNGECLACVPLKAESGLPPLDLYVLLDKSGSMTGDGWEAASGAIKAFVQEPASSGLSVALSYFPRTEGETSDPQCSGALYVTPLVLWQLLPQGASGITSSIDATIPGGTTPTQDVANGGLLGAKQRKISFPEHEVNAVFISDGEPCCGECPVEDAPGIGQIAAAYKAGTPSIRSHAISVQTSAQAVMSEIATKGGGLYFPIAASQTAILQALREIRAKAVQCAFPVPGGSFDPNKVSVALQQSGTTPAALTRVIDVSQCTGNNWYFEAGSVVLCSQACDVMRGDPGAKVQITVDTCQ